MKIRKILAVGLMVITPLTAHADILFPIDCKLAGDVADKAMRDRYRGVALTTQMNMVENSPPLLENIIISAYDSPRWQGAKRQRESIIEFREKWETLCYKSRQ